MENKRITKAVLLMAASLTVMSGAIISPALPQIDEYFPKATGLLTKLVLTMPALIIAVTSTLVGYLADKYGRKIVLVCSLVIYGIAGTAGFVIDDFFLLLTSRAFLGLGVAGVMSMVNTLIGDYFQGFERNRFMGWKSSFMAMGGIVFLNLGGLLADWNWRGPFLVYAFAFIVLPAAILFLVEPNINREKQPLPSDRQASNDRVVGTIFLLGFLGMIYFYMVPTQIPFLLKEETGVKASMIGLAISVATITAALASMSYAYIRTKLTFRTIYQLSFLLMAVAYGTIGVFNSYVGIVAGLAIGGMGVGLLMPNGNLWLLDVVAERKRGRIMGALSSVVFFGQFLSPIVVAPVVDNWSLNAAFFVAAASMVLIAAGLFMLKRKE